MFLHSTALIPLGWEYKQLDMSKSYPLDGGHSYMVPTDTKWMNQTLGRPSPALIVEDGKPLAQPNAIHSEISKQGLGRYSLWHGYLYFSTSDNSDPSAISRCYEFLYSADQKIEFKQKRVEQFSLLAWEVKYFLVFLRVLWLDKRVK